MRFHAERCLQDARESVTARKGAARLAASAAHELDPDKIALHIEFVSYLQCTLLYVRRVLVFYPADNYSKKNLNCQLPARFAYFFQLRAKLIWRHDFLRGQEVRKYDSALHDQLFDPFLIDVNRLYFSFVDNILNDSHNEYHLHVVLQRGFVRISKDPVKELVHLVNGHLAHVRYLFFPAPARRAGGNAYTCRPFHSLHQARIGDWKTPADGRTVSIDCTLVFFEERAV